MEKRLIRFLQILLPVMGALFLGIGIGENQVAPSPTFTAPPPPIEVHEVQTTIERPSISNLATQNIEHAAFNYGMAWVLLEQHSGNKKVICGVVHDQDDLVAILPGWVPMTTNVDYEELIKTCHAL